MANRTRRDVTQVSRRKTKTIMRGLAFGISKEISEDEFGYG